VCVRARLFERVYVNTYVDMCVCMCSNRYTCMLKCVHTYLFVPRELSVRGTRWLDVLSVCGNVLQCVVAVCCSHISVIPCG